MRFIAFAGVVIVVVLALFTYPGATAISMVIHLTPTLAPSGSPPQGTLPWLHVEHPAHGRPYISDDQGRLILLHGATPASLIDLGSSANNPTSDMPTHYPIDPAAYANGQCPQNSSQSRYPPLCQSDIDAMAAMGFNSIRLPVSWSLLEPRRGEFSQTYLDRVAQVVEWAGSAGLYVIIDMHQNAYSKFVGAGPGVDLTYNSGAPQWATNTDGLPSRVFQSKRELNAAVFQAFTNFWYDRAGIQDEYIKTIAFIASRFKDNSTVAGYSLFNEPQPGWSLPPGYEDLLLFPFYRRVIDAITGAGDGLPCWTGFFMPASCGYPDLGVHDQRHLVFLETGLMREITDSPTHLGLPVSSYPNVVLSIHGYTHIYTLDQLLFKENPENANYPWGGFDQSYSTADSEARAMNVALFVAEFGDDPKEDAFEVTNQLLEQEKHGVGSAFWTWKENGNPGWGVYDPPPAGSTASSGCLRPARERLLARVYPAASADPSADFHYDPTTGAFTMSAAGAQGGPPTVITIPHEVTGAVSSHGAVSIQVGPGPHGGRTVIGTPSGGDYTISVAAAPLTLSSCP